MNEIFFFIIASFLVSSSHETLVNENRCFCLFFWGGAVVEPVKGVGGMPSSNNPLLPRDSTLSIVKLARQIW